MGSGSGGPGTGRAQPSAALTADPSRLRWAVAPPSGDRDRHLIPLPAGIGQWPGGHVLRDCAPCGHAMHSGICSSGERAECGRRRDGDCVSRGAPRRRGGSLVPCGGRSGRAGPGRVDTMSRQGGRGTENKKMVTAGPARRAHGVGHPGNRPGAGVIGPGPQHPVRRGLTAISGTGRSPFMGG